MVFHCSIAYGLLGTDYHKQLGPDKQACLCTDQPNLTETHIGPHVPEDQLLTTAGDLQIQGQGCWNAALPDCPIRVFQLRKGLHQH